MRPASLLAVTFLAAHALAQNWYIPDNLPAAGNCNVIPFGDRVGSVCDPATTSIWSNQKYQTRCTVADLGGMPNATPKAVKLSEDAKTMLRADLQNEHTTILEYRQRVKDCDSLEEYALAESIREILMQEQEHLIDLATALGEDAPDLSKK